MKKTSSCNISDITPPSPPLSVLRIDGLRGGREGLKHIKKLLSFVVCYLLFTVCCLMLVTSATAGTITGEIEIYGLSSISKQELLYMLGIQPGGFIDAGSIRQGIKRAFLKGI